MLLQERAISEIVDCPYLHGVESRLEYFFASSLDENELDELLSNGWRKFGYYFFRPLCIGCFKCVPIRVRVDEFTPSKNQKKLIKRNKDVKVRFGPIRYSDDAYRIYSDHSANRFSQDADMETFLFNFYSPSNLAFQSEYYLENQLIGVGYLDRSREAFNSVYFSFDTSFSSFSLGTFSILKEIEYAASLNMKRYYLGYYISENKSMRYKNRYFPNEKYDWDKKQWILDMDALQDKVISGDCVGG